MSIKIMSLVWDYADSSGSELLLLLALADMANDSGVCWPSIDRLAKKVRVDRRQAMRLLGKLETKQYLTKKRRPNQTTVYQIEVGVIRDTCHADHPGSDIHTTLEVTSVPPLGVTSIPPKSSVKPNKEPSIETSNAGVVFTDPDPSVTTPLMNAFLAASKMPIGFNPQQWTIPLVEMLKAGVTPEDVTQAVEDNLTGGYGVNTPRSILKRALNVTAKRQAKTIVKVFDPEKSIKIDYAPGA